MQEVSSPTSETSQGAYDAQAPRVVSVLGLPCSGKSTLSHRLVEDYDYTLVSPDEMIYEEYGGYRVGVDVTPEEHGDRFRKASYDALGLIAALVEEGNSVVYDCPSFNREKRERDREFFEEHGANTYLIYLMASRDYLWSVAQQRNKKEGVNNHHISEPVLDQLSSLFEEPTDDENALVYDIESLRSLEDEDKEDEEAEDEALQEFRVKIEGLRGELLLENYCVEEVPKEVLDLIADYLRQLIAGGVDELGLDLDSIVLTDKDQSEPDSRALVIEFDEDHIFDKATIRKAFEDLLNAKEDTQEGDEEGQIEVDFIEITTDNVQW